MEKKYTETVGRRKTSTARVRLTEASKGSIKVNDRDAKEYFPTRELTKVIYDAFTVTKPEKDFEVTIRVSGGGIHSQAEAIRHGIARALVEIDEAFKAIVKKEGYLKRDPRAKERRKFGLKKARKAPQWSKR
jgi:small subunit ribosomal protein S9